MSVLATHMLRKCYTYSRYICARAPAHVRGAEGAAQGGGGRLLSSSAALCRRGSRITPPPPPTAQDIAVEGAIRPEFGEKPDCERLLRDATVDTPQNPADADNPDKKQVLWETGAYPTNSNFQQSQAKYSYRPSTPPEQTSIMLFPGQGTQYVGMARELLDYPNVQQMFE